jgi:hypothetical protein
VMSIVPFGQYKPSVKTFRSGSELSFSFLEFY